MKRLALLVAVVLVVGTGLALSVGAAKDETGGIKGKEISLTGRLSCTFCSLAHPDMACKKGCCSHCIQAGDPPVVIDQQGNMYLLVTNEVKKTLMTPERLEMAGEQVAVKGLLVKAKGIQAIIVDSMTKP
jgi:hypothetical protein